MPVARVIVQCTLVRGTQCPNNQYEETLLPECRMTEWSPWSSCSVSCGHGIKTRRCAYFMPEKAIRSHCNQRTYDMTSCYLASCLSSMANDNSKSSNNAMWMVSEWSAWSHCCVTCGTGMRTRSRTMLQGRDNPQCRLEYQLMKKEICHGMKPSCEQGRLIDMIEKKTSCGANDNNFLTRDACEDICNILLRGRTSYNIAKKKKQIKIIFFLYNEFRCLEDDKNTRSMTLPWSAWSACSSVCGRGTQVRVRAYKVKFLVMGFCSEPLEEFRDCEVSCDSAQMYCLSDTRKIMIKSMETAEKNINVCNYLNQVHVQNLLIDSILM
ncbi:unnamed protein product [Rotaria sp. Silwood2]|nr:unnamed protein product [Rotaria sp. Silwood2]